MTPAEAAAPEQSGADPVVTVLLVVPVIVASTEPDSAKSDVAAIVITVDLIIPILPFLQFADSNFMFNESPRLNSVPVERITNAQRISLNCVEPVTGVTKESGFDWAAHPCGACSEDFVLQNVPLGPTVE